MKWIAARDKGVGTRETAPVSQVSLRLSGELPTDPCFSHTKANRMQALASHGGDALTAEGELLEISAKTLGDKIAYLLSPELESVLLGDTFASHSVDTWVVIEIKSWVGKEFGGNLVVGKILNAPITIRYVRRGIGET